MILTVVARAKAKDTTSVERQLKSRSRRLSRLQSSMSALHAKVKRDLRSSDPDRFLTALAVGIMAETGEDPVIGARKKHVHLGDDGAYYRRGGKKRAITNTAIVHALEDAYEAKEDDDELFAHDMGRVTADMVDQYLSGFKLSMKDVRGMLAAQQVVAKLRRARAKGSELPKHKRSRTKVLTNEFMKVLGDVADDAGVEAEMLRYNFLAPGLEGSYLSDGSVEGRTASSNGDMAARVAQKFLNAL